MIYELYNVINMDTKVICMDPRKYNWDDILEIDKGEFEIKLSKLFEKNFQNPVKDMNINFYGSHSCIAEVTNIFGVRYQFSWKLKGYAPWNLNQVDINDRELFGDTLVNILEEGRKLTPMEVAKVKIFLKNDKG